MAVYHILVNFFVYGFFGWCSEVAFAAVKERKFVNRGFLNGPLCPIYGIGVTAIVTLMDAYMDNLLLLFLLSGVLVTALEWVTGFLLEVLFHHKWWDYSKMPLNLNGYVCLPFSLLWGAACTLIVKYIHPLLWKLLSLIPLWLGIFLLGVLSAALAVDLYVTVTGILKLNKRLERLDEIAKELHRISDQMGENIYENMMDGLEKQEKAKQKAEEKTAELREKAEELKAKTGEFMERAEGLRAKGGEFMERAESLKAKSGEFMERAESLKAKSGEFMERAEGLRAKTGDLRDRADKLRERYAQLLENVSGTDKRIMKAFPKMQSRRHKERFIELRERYLDKKKGRKDGRD